MTSLSKAQPSGYALSVGILLKVAEEATKLQQLNFENQKNIAQGEGRASQALANSTSSAMSKEADGMAANALGDVLSSSMGLGMAAIGGLYDVVKTVKNPYTSQMNSVDAFDEEITKVNQQKPDFNLRPLNNEDEEEGLVREQLNRVKTVDIKTAKASAFTDDLETARNQPGDSTYDDFKAKVRSTGDRLHTDSNHYQTQVGERAQRLQMLGQLSGQVAKSKQETEAANNKSQQAAIEASKISAQYTSQSFKTVYDQTSQNGGTLESAKEMVYRAMGGVAESNKA